MNKVVNDTVVTLTYTLADPDGNMLDNGQEPLIYLHGGYETIFPSIENVLEGKTVGDSVTVKMQPAEAFGEYNPEFIQVVPQEKLPQPLKVGMMIEGTPGGGAAGESVFFTVTDIADGKAVLDGNHPLAGTALVFTCTIAALRPASEEEIAARHPL